MADDHDKLIEAFDAVSDALHWRRLTAEQYATVYARLCTSLMHGRPELVPSFMLQLFQGLNDLETVEQAAGMRRRKKAGVAP